MGSRSTGGIRWACFFPITTVPDGERGRMLCSLFITLYSLILPSLQFKLSILTNDVFSGFNATYSNGKRVQLSAVRGEDFLLGQVLFELVGVSIYSKRLITGS